MQQCDCHGLSIMGLQCKVQCTELHTWCNVTVCPADGHCDMRVIIFYQPGQAEIRETGLEVFSQQYICGADVAMYNARLAAMVQIGQRPSCPQRYSNSRSPFHWILPLFLCACCQDRSVQKSAHDLDMMYHAGIAGYHISIT
jgi:hypothetical protein